MNLTFLTGRVGGYPRYRHTLRVGGASRLAFGKAGDVPLCDAAVGVRVGSD